YAGACCGTGTTTLRGREKQTRRARGGSGPPPEAARQAGSSPPEATERRPTTLANDELSHNRTAGRGGPMKAVRLHEFHTQPVIDDVPDPKISGPLDVIVKIGGAGVCRTDL